MNTPQAVADLALRLRELGWVSDLFVGGSVATGDYRAGLSDLDLVALVDRPLDGSRRSDIVTVHRELDATSAAGADLGCAYVATSALSELATRYPTWTHGALVERALSGVARAELVRHGFAVVGRSPQDVLPPMSDEDLRSAARDELTGYWTTAAHRPWWWLDPSFADLGLTSMARGRHTIATGELITKSSAIDAVHAPDWLRRDLRARRDGMPAQSPRLRTAWHAWRDACRTTATARRSA